MENQTWTTTRGLNIYKEHGLGRKNYADKMPSLFLVSHKKLFYVSHFDSSKHLSKSPLLPLTSWIHVGYTAISSQLSTADGPVAHHREDRCTPSLLEGQLDPTLHIYINFRIWRQAAKTRDLYLLLYLTFALLIFPKFISSISKKISSLLKRYCRVHAPCHYC